MLLLPTVCVWDSGKHVLTETFFLKTYCCCWDTWTRGDILKFSEFVYIYVYRCVNIYLCVYICMSLYIYINYKRFYRLFFKRLLD